MSINPGCPIVVFPTFHMAVDLEQRVSITEGVEQVGESFVPRPVWRPLSDHERGLLLDPPTIATPETLRKCVCLFQLPQHLRSAWWRLLEQASASAQLIGFESFAAEVTRFLAFKEIAVPQGAALDLLLGRPGERSLIQEGLACRPELWGWINLGDEPVSLTFMNATTPQPDCLVVRLRIDPGEGCRLPSPGVCFDADTSGNEEPAVLLQIRSPEEARAIPES